MLIWRGLPSHLTGGPAEVRLQTGFSESQVAELQNCFSFFLGMEG